MADLNFSGSVVESLTELDEMVLELKAWAATASDLAAAAGAAAPQWPFLLGRHVGRLEAAVAVVDERVRAVLKGSAQ